MRKVLVVTFLILIPIILIIAGIKSWNIFTKKMSVKDKENALAKVTITSVIITITAIVYMILFNFYKISIK